MLVPDVGVGRGRARLSFLSPWGEGRAEKAHGLDFARPARSDGPARSAGTLTHMTRASASSRRATRHLRIYPSRPVGPARGLWCRGEVPRVPPEELFALSHARGCRIPPHPCDVSRGRPSADGTCIT